MTILILGATGFIGRHVTAHLLAQGHVVRGAVRDTASFARRFPQAEAAYCDLAKLDDTALPGLLDGVDCIINCAGLLDGKQLAAVHADGPARLYEEAAAQGVRHVILISAISADANAGTAYASTKLAGEQVLAQSAIPCWTILRPSLVHGPGSYGGTSVMRGLAALPWVMPVIGAGDQAFTPIDMDDLCALIAQIVADPARHAGATLAPQGPQRVTMAEMLPRLRQWLDLPPARLLHVPRPLVKALCKIGDLLLLGPINSTALAQLDHGNAGDPASYIAQTGLAPRSFEQSLAVRPSTVQDRWHARLWALKPLSTLALVLIWLSSGLIGLVTGLPETEAVTRLLHLPDAATAPLGIAACLLDLALAGWVASGRATKLAACAQVATTIGFTIVIGAALPGLWANPFGPLTKNLAILVTIACWAALRDEK